jgi:hypothetical protein
MRALPSDQIPSARLALRAQARPSLDSVAPANLRKSAADGRGAIRRFSSADFEAFRLLVRLSPGKSMPWQRLGLPRQFCRGIEIALFGSLFALVKASPSNDSASGFRFLLRSLGRGIGGFEFALGAAAHHGSGASDQPDERRAQM